MDATVSRDPTERRTTQIETSRAVSADCCKCMDHLDSRRRPRSCGGCCGTCPRAKPRLSSSLSTSLMPRACKLRHRRFVWMLLVVLAAGLIETNSYSLCCAGHVRRPLEPSNAGWSLHAPSHAWNALGYANWCHTPAAYARTGRAPLRSRVPSQGRALSHRPVLQ